MRVVSRRSGHPAWSPVVWVQVMVFLLPALAARAQSGIPYPEAEKRIKAHMAAIEKRAQAMGEIYGSGHSDQTVAEALRKAGATGNLKEMSHNWGSSLAGSWVDIHGFYAEHENYLGYSLMTLRERDPLDPADMAYLDAGVQCWSAEERKLANLMETLMNTWGQEEAQRQATGREHDRLWPILQKQGGDTTAKVEAALAPYHAKERAIEEAKGKTRAEIGKIIAERCFKPLVLISSVRVDYEPGKKLHDTALAKLHEAEADLKAEEPLFHAAESKRAAAEDPYNQAKAAERSARDVQMGAASRLEDEKLLVAYLEELVFLARLRDVGGSPAQFAKEYAKRDAMRDALKERGVAFDPAWSGKGKGDLMKELSKAQERERDARGKYDAAHKVFLEAGEALYRATSDYDLAAADHARHAEAMGRCQARVDLLRDATANGRLQGVPLLTKVEVPPVYSATWWDPADALRQIDEELARAKASTARAEALRESVKADWKKAFDEEMAKRRALVSLPAYSALAQWGVEAADFLIDVLRESGKKGLAAGGIGAVTKKVIDLGVELAAAKGDARELGGYKFLDPEAIRADMARQAGSRTSWSAEAKDYGAKVGKKLLADQAAKRGSDALALALKRSAGLRAFMDGLPASVAQAKSGFAQFAKGAKDKGFKDILTSALKGTAKSKLKALLDSLIEDGPWREAFAAEAVTIEMHNLYRIASDGCDALYQEQVRLQSLHDAVVAMYDQNDVSFYHGTSRRLAPDATYTAKLIFQGAEPSGEKVTVGPAAAQPQGSHQHKFSSKDLAGAVEIHVAVQGF